MPNFNLSTINLLGIKNPLSDLLRLSIDDPPIKAGPVSLVASRSAYLFDLQQEGIAVAVQVNFFDELNMARGFTLKPELLTGTGPKAGLTRFPGLLPALRVHISDHKDFRSFPILDDRRDQSLGSSKIYGKFIHKKLPD
jgi:hypothetical protein